MARRPRNEGRRPRTYRRRPATIEPYDVVLIVCEGAKTEPAYFGRLREAYRLSSANIRITPADGSDPLSIVSFAETYLEEDYNRIYCVFDRDDHQNYEQAIQKAAALNNDRDGRLFAITSWPCFEFWILLHFKYSSAPFGASGGRSPCGNVIVELKNYVAGYTKGYATIFDDLKPNLQTALGHAERLTVDNAATGSCNPSTKVHELVEYLTKLKST